MVPCHRTVPSPEGAIISNLLLVSALRRLFGSADLIVDLAGLVGTAASQTEPLDGPCLVSDGQPDSTWIWFAGLRAPWGDPPGVCQSAPALGCVDDATTGGSPADRRLLGSLEVDASGAACDLGWTPPVGMDEGLRSTAEWYRSATRS
jgi:hypothetical protein